MARSRKKGRRYNKNRYHKKQKRFKRRQKSELARIFYKYRKLILKHPLISAILSIIVSILLIRVFISNTIFSNNITEFRMWFLFFAILIGIIGLFALWVWIRNNVPSFFGKGNIKIKFK